jgi:hypothetical protein
MCGSGSGANLALRIARSAKPNAIVGGGASGGSVALAIDASRVERRVARALLCGDCLCSDDHGDSGSFLGHAPLHLPPSNGLLQGRRVLQSCALGCRRSLLVLRPLLRRPRRRDCRLIRRVSSALLAPRGKCHAFRVFKRMQFVDKTQVALDIAQCAVIEVAAVELGAEMGVVGGIHRRGRDHRGGAGWYRAAAAGKETLGEYAVLVFGPAECAPAVGGEERVQLCRGSIE